MPGRPVTRLKSCKWELMKFYTKAEAVEIKKKKKKEISRLLFFVKEKSYQKELFFKKKKTQKKMLCGPSDD